MTDQLLVHRHHCRYRVHPNHPDPARVRRRLDDVVAERIPARLADLLSAHLPPGDGVVVLRRLGVRVLLGTSDPDLLAPTDLWTKGLLTAILKALARDDDSVMRFPSRAAYLAAFLRALTSGDAFTQWPFEQFRRWRELGPAAAATAACEAYSDDIAPAFALLAAAPGDTLRRVLAMLSDEQAARIGVAAGLRTAALGRTPELAGLDGNELVAQAVRSGRQFAASPNHLALWLLAQMPQLSPTAIPSLAAALARACDDASAGVAEDSDVLTSPFAGCSLLLIGLGAINLEQAIVAVGVSPDAAPPLAGRLRWWALLSALGREHRVRARFDPALLRLAGDPGGAYGAEVVERLLDPRACAALADRLTATMAEGPDTASASAREAAHLDISDFVTEAALGGLVRQLALFAVRDLARRLPGFTASSAPYVAVNLLVGAGRFRFGPATCSASLPEVALRVALQMAGWEDRTVVASWLPGGALRFDRAER
jgi:hypothetical protein